VGTFCAAQRQESLVYKERRAASPPREIEKLSGSKIARRRDILLDPVLVPACDPGASVMPSFEPTWVTGPACGADLWHFDRDCPRFLDLEICEWADPYTFCGYSSTIGDVYGLISYFSSSFSYCVWSGRQVPAIWLELGVCYGSRWSALIL